MQFEPVSQQVFLYFHSPQRARNAAGGAECGRAECCSSTAHRTHPRAYGHSGKVGIALLKGGVSNFRILSTTVLLHRSDDEVKYLQDQLQFVRKELTEAHCALLWSTLCRFLHS